MSTLWVDYVIDKMDTDSTQKTDEKVELKLAFLTDNTSNTIPHKEVVT